MARSTDSYRTERAARRDPLRGNPIIRSCDTISCSSAGSAASSMAGAAGLPAPHAGAQPAHSPASPAAEPMTDTAGSPLLIASCAEADSADPDSASAILGPLANASASAPGAGAAPPSTG
eukprot:scaffold5814_cov123-Isochrysis_galbana.AAC.7